MRWIEAVIILYATANLIFIAVLFLNHWQFPLFLETMEGTVFQHFQRAAALKPVYPAPQPEYVPLAYNPLFYYFAVPFSLLFGVELSTLRLTAFAGGVVAALFIYLIVHRHTGSRWWGAVAAGLFAAAYRVMDAHLDTAHSDSWLIASILLGAYLIDFGKFRLWSLLGVFALVAAFWFKQHGAIFVLAGIAYLTWRDGVWGSLAYWIAAIAFGPFVYLVLGPWLFGSHFHYFTWEVPRGWSEVNVFTVLRYGYHLLANYGVLFVAAIIAWLIAAGQWRERFTVWHVMLPAAGLSGLMGSLDPGSSDNVYIPVGTVLIVTGTMAFAEFASHAAARKRLGTHLPLLIVSFALMAYDPRTVLLSSRASDAYADLITMLKGLNGPVYSPSLGQLPDSFRLHPAGIWVALDDISRGSNEGEQSKRKVRELIAPALPKSGSAYLLLNMPMGRGGLLGDLHDSYTLKADFGDRYAPLGGLPGRFLTVVTSYPRYLYQYRPASTNQDPR